MFDILGIGEALIEFSETSPSQYQHAFAGDILNSLYYASRLGLRTSLYSKFGKDSYTPNLIVFLDENNIDHSHCTVSKDNNNGLYIIRGSHNGEPQFTFFREHSAARTTFDVFDESKLVELIQQSKMIIFSAIALAVFHNIERFIDILSRKKNETIIYFDTNVRTPLWNDLTRLREWIERLSSVVDVVSVSLSDDKKLFQERSKIEIIAYYKSVGYKKIILRDGADDIYLSFDGTTETIKPIPVLIIVDVTGAGDAFNAGFMYGLLHQKSPFECAEIACRASTQVIAFHGGIVKEFDPTKVLESL